MTCWLTGLWAVTPKEELRMETQMDTAPVLNDTDDLLYTAWGVIANVSEGDWTKQPQEWQDAAKTWRDRWHAHLDSQPS